MDGEREETNEFFLGRRGRRSVVFAAAAGAGVQAIQEALEVLRRGEQESELILSEEKRREEKKGERQTSASTRDAIGDPSRSREARAVNQAAISLPLLATE